MSKKKSVNESARNVNFSVLCSTVQCFTKDDYVAGYDLAKSIFACFWLPLTAVDRRLSACNSGSKLQCIFEMTKYPIINLLA